MCSNPTLQASRSHQLAFVKGSGVIEVCLPAPGRTQVAVNAPLKRKHS